MDIHKPKPFHGWREFLKEYGIIVLGVLTALALEQTVELMRERHHAAEARDSIRAEIAANLGLLARREAVEPCVSRRLDEAQALIGHPPAVNAPVWIGHPPLYPMRDSQFRSAAQAGHVTLLPTGEQAAYARLYVLFDRYNSAQDSEQKALGDLRVLEQHPQMTPEVAYRLRSAVQQARVARWTEEVTGVSMHDVAKTLALAGDWKNSDPSRFKTQPMCLPIGTPRDEALKLVVRNRPHNQAYDEP